VVYCCAPGIQRPLKDISELSDSIYIPKGVNIPALDRQHKWEFIPTIDVKVNYVQDVPKSGLDGFLTFGNLI
jgi:vacuolar-type H+-ATPase catalytic subunit A/Vma1